MQIFLIIHNHSASESQATVIIKGFISKLYEVSYAGKSAANSLLFPDMASSIISRDISTLIQQMSIGSYLGRVPIITDLLGLESISLFTIKETQGSILRKTAQTFNRNFYQKMSGLILMTQSTDLTNAHTSNTYKLKDLEVLDINLVEDYSAIPHTITATLSNVAQLATDTKEYQVTINEFKGLPLEFQLDLAEVWQSPSTLNLTQIQSLQDAIINSPTLSYKSTTTSKSTDPNPTTTTIISNMTKQWLYNEAFQHLRGFQTYSLSIANPPVLDAGDYIQLPNKDILLVADVTIDYYENVAQVALVPLKYWQYNIQYVINS